MGVRRIRSFADGDQLVRSCQRTLCHLSKSASRQYRAMGRLQHLRGSLAHPRLCCCSLSSTTPCPMGRRPSKRGSATVTRIRRSSAALVTLGSRGPHAAGRQLSWRGPSSAAWDAHRHRRRLPAALGQAQRDCAGFLCSGSNQPLGAAQSDRRSQRIFAILAPPGRCRRLGSHLFRKESAMERKRLQTFARAPGYLPRMRAWRHRSACVSCRANKFAVGGLTAAALFECSGPTTHGRSKFPKMCANRTEAATVPSPQGNKVDRLPGATRGRRGKYPRSLSCTRIAVSIRT
jgi:hypothetical protein